jgi:hypothetical protein
MCSCTGSLSFSRVVGLGGVMAKSLKRGMARFMRRRGDRSVVVCLGHKLLNVEFMAVFSLP